MLLADGSWRIWTSEAIHPSWKLSLTRYSSTEASHNLHGWGHCCCVCSSMTFQIFMVSVHHTSSDTKKTVTVGTTEDKWGKAWLKSNTGLNQIEWYWQRVSARIFNSGTFTWTVEFWKTLSLSKRCESMLENSTGGLRLMKGCRSQSDHHTTWDVKLRTRRSLTFIYNSINR